MPVYCYGATLTVVFCLLLVLADFRDSQTMRWLTKPIASTGFMAAALSLGWPSHAYGVAVIIALALSMAGDLLLIPKSKAAFLGGLVAFLAGHLGFGAAFLVRGISPLWAGVALVPLVGIAWVVHRWLRPHLPERMRIPVIAYIVVISTMVTLAIGTLGHTPDRQGQLLLLGAVSFFVSDLAVARNKFVSPNWTNRAWGLPLYYGAQLIFAYSMVMGG